MKAMEHNRYKQAKESESNKKSNKKPKTEAQIANEAIIAKRTESLDDLIATARKKTLWLKKIWHSEFSISFRIQMPLKLSLRG